MRWLILLALVATACAAREYPYGEEFNPLNLTKREVHFGFKAPNITWTNKDWVKRFF